MKKTILFLGLLFYSLFSIAQSSIALIGGVHNASVTPHFLNYPDTLNKASVNKARVMIGVVANVPIKGGLFFRSGVLYTARGSSWTQFYDTANVYASRKQQLLTAKTDLNVNYIDIPLNLMYKLPLGKKSRFVVGGGPQLSLLYNGNKSYSTTTVSQPDLNTDVKYEYEQEINKDLLTGQIPERFRILHVGANAFGGIEFNRVFFSVNWSKGLGEFYEEGGRDYKHQTLGASIGIFLGKKQIIEKPKKEVALPQQPKDTDGDGIADNADKCPEVSGVAKYEGCPVPDSDKDGINDDEDGCPQVAGTVKYNGCPVPDSDGDGINDEEDKCKDQYGLTRYGGCPVPDTDKDGVNDENDTCPQVPGTAENSGCPAVKEEVVKQVEYAARNIYFATGSDKLLSKSFAQLDEVVKLLNADVNLKLSIEGHTDNKGEEAFNQKMSESRAASVKAYLISKGIEEDRISSKGFGESQPVADNSTEAGRAKNRRVEMKVSY